MGGPMMGIALPSPDVPVIKGTTGILAMGDTDTSANGYLPCIRCAFCVQACPMSLMPSTLSRASEAERWELLKE